MFFDENNTLGAENSCEINNHEEFVKHSDNTIESDASDAEAEVHTFLEKYFIGKDNVK